MKVENMKSTRTGRAVANQFIIRDSRKAIYFQSYKSIVARIDNTGLTLDAKTWDYSRTTSKYLHRFLASEYRTMNKKEIEKAIESGEIVLGDLN